MLPNNFNTQITFRVKKFNSCFEIKDKVNFEHKNDLFYHAKCPANNCKGDYVGKTGRRISERMMDHNGRDVNSHLLKHHMEKNINIFKINTLLLLAVVFKIIQ